MLCCALSSIEKRIPLSCNYNHHRNEAHPDRIIDMHDLIYLVRGEWEIYQDGVSYRLHSGDTLFLRGGCHHYGLSKCEGQIDTMYVHIPCLPADCGLDHYGLVKDCFVFPTQLHIPAGNPIPSLISSMIECHQKKSAYSDELSSAYLALLLGEMSVLANRNETTLPPTESSDIVSFLIGHITANPSRFISIDEMCKIANVSRRTLYNYFIAQTSLSPYEYQLQNKLASAHEMLEHEPETTLRVIASRFGFCDEYHFSKLYKAKYGYSPKEKKNLRHSER